MEVGVREEVKAVGGAAKAEEMEAEMEVAAKVTAVEGVTAAVTAAAKVTAAAAAKVVRFARQPSPY
jgi:hypothetical protein